MLLVAVVLVVVRDFVGYFNGIVRSFCDEDLSSKDGVTFDLRKVRVCVCVCVCGV